jgi:hypothetical protein
MDTPAEKKQQEPRFGAKAFLTHSLRVVSAFTLLLVGGFFIFAHCVSLLPSSDLPDADGIVALTGDEDRISEAVGLLAGGKARRLLISGVYRGTNKPEIISLNNVGRHGAFLVRCCVDLDKRALNT